MSKKDNILFTRILIFVHIVLVLTVLSSGSLAGLYYSQPYIHVSLKIPQDNVNTWHILSNNDGSIITGGNFKTTISFYNTSIFPITYEPEKIDVFYYPIGERPSCMFLHPEDNHFNPLSEFQNITQVYNSIDEASKAFFKLNDLKVTLNSSRWDFTSPKYYELNWNVGFKVPNERASIIKQLYMDCAKFNTVLFSVHIQENKLNYLFMTKKIKSTFELLIPMNCKLDQNLNSLFSSHRVIHQSVLFGEFENTHIPFT
ncbi:hypothetical protein MACJ_003531 [Theileria orientalis]|uniref:Uncharacterized protein n=1 Tax=Theileria orientalis TaxID=68886 RepID=A0A976SKE5_THEOR|nr:hypothetical protein MACJ_003531 [Theileria orientalis]